jgi:hypothetical protein
VTFAVKFEPGYGWRKARLACWEHLGDVIMQQRALNGYSGAVLVAVRPGEI